MVGAAAIKRGDVWWYESPWDKRRPVCVVTRDQAIRALRSLLVIPATSVLRGVVTEVKLDEEDGMPRSCALSLDSIWTVRKSLLVERITTLTPVRMHEICAALRLATGC